MNVHAPERQAAETHSDYRSRLQLSREAIAASQSMPATARTKPAISKRDAHRAKVAIQHIDATQPKFDEPRKRKVKDAIKATWPKSDDQKAQSRPLIVLGPNRERDPLKREKPKSAVAKRMDRPHRVGMIDRGHRKLMTFFGTI